MLNHLIEFFLDDIYPLEKIHPREYQAGNSADYPVEHPIDTLVRLGSANVSGQV